MLKKRLIAVFALAFLLAACLPSANVEMNSVAEEPVNTEIAVSDDGMHDEDEAMSSNEQDNAEQSDDAETATEDSSDQMSATLEPMAVEVAYDFPIEPYQGFTLDALTLVDVFQNGNPTVVNFFASGCPICVLEMDHLQEAYDAFGDTVNFVAVDIGSYVGLGSNEGALQLLADKGSTFPAGTTPDIQVLREYNVLGTPTTVFFNSDGSVNEVYTGLLTDEQLAAFITALD